MIQWAGGRRARLQRAVHRVRDVANLKHPWTCVQYGNGEHLKTGSTDGNRR
jgi:hypothetical protein